MMALALLTAGNAGAEELTKDSLKVVDMEEVVVIANPKENRKLRELPVAATILSQENLRANQVNSVKSLTGVVPNLFIPDYGSKLTTSIYIRGIGSRINTPSVGLYVDNIPYIDKSAFDFNYADIERIDVLRGPQGTLYGRNTMGGLIKVHTKSPFTYQGTDIRMGAGSHNQYNASLTHYHRISNQFAFSTGGFYEYNGGFFRNAARNGEKIDKSQAGGGRVRAIYLPTSNLKVDMTLNYEYSDQGGYPYQYTGITPSALSDKKMTEDRADYIGQIAYNERSSYRRGLLNAGVNLEYQAQHFILSAVTGYQNLNDRMFLDQDFTEKAIYTLEQKQKSNTLSEEIIFKSKANKRWQWATGVFGLYQALNTRGPVTFWEDGVKSVIEGNVNKIFAGMPSQAPQLHQDPQLHLGVNNSSLLVSGDFDTPIWNAAIFHQSTLNNLFIKGLSLTVGLRLDYEKMHLDYTSLSDPTDFNFSMKMTGCPPVEARNLLAQAEYDGKISDDYLQLLPQFALQYEWKKGNSVYATASKGYRSGGYNVQMFSDLISGKLKNAMIQAIKKSKEFGPYATMIDKFAPKDNVPDVKEATRYKPEYSWNYEVGSHLTLWEGRLWADLSAFYMDMHDQQISQFAASGLGRTTLNAGKSRSYGGEIALRASLTDGLSMHANYGYTYATFTDYVEYTKDKNGNLQVKADYNGKYIPFVPKHTLNIGGEYAISCRPNAFINRVVLQANYNAAGRIYWTERNDVSQAFYGTLNGRVNVEKGNASISLWARNLLNKDYAAFYFETMNRGFKQEGRPIQFGVDLRCRF